MGQGIIEVGGLNQWNGFSDYLGGSVSAEQTPGWLSAAVTASIAFLGAIWALVRRVMTSVTREEVEACIGKLETRFEDRVEKLTREIEKTMGNLHKDNTDARHRLRDEITAPMNRVNTNLTELLKEMRQNKNDSNRRENETLRHQRKFDERR